MSKSQKIILISILPALLTLVFIVYFVAPAIGNMNKLKGELKEEQLAYAETQSKVESLKQDKKLLKKVEELRIKLFNFDTQVPAEDELAILLVDLEKFSKAFNVKVYTLNSGAEKTLEIIDPKEQLSEDKTKAKNTRKARKKVEDKPVTLVKIPLEIMVMGYYSDVLNFINTLENYQRKTSIESILVSNYRKDKDNIKPRVELTINCAVYKLISNENTESEQEDKS